MFGKAPKYDCALITNGPAQQLIQVENFDLNARKSTSRPIIGGTSAVLLAAMLLEFQSISKFGRS